MLRARTARWDSTSHVSPLRVEAAIQAVSAQTAQPCCTVFKAASALLPALTSLARNAQSANMQRVGRPGLPDEAHRAHGHLLLATDVARQQHRGLLVHLQTNNA